MSAWIKPELQLPEQEIIVLIRTTACDFPVWIGYHERGVWFFASDVPVRAPERVSGWMHLPSPEDDR